MMSTFISFIFLLSSHCFCQLISEYPKRNEIFVFGSHNSLRAPTHIRLFYLACNSIDLLNRHHFVFSFGSLFSLLILNGSDAYAYILIFFIQNFPLKKYYCFCFCLSRCNSISKFIGIFHLYGCYLVPIVSKMSSEYATTGYSNIHGEKYMHDTNHK